MFDNESERFSSRSVPGHFYLQYDDETAWEAIRNHYYEPTIKRHVGFMSQDEAFEEANDFEEKGVEFKILNSDGQIVTVGKVQ